MAVVSRHRQSSFEISFEISFRAKSVWSIITQTLLTSYFLLHFLEMSKRRAPQVQSKRWVFTLNNYTEEEVQALKDNQQFKFILFGKEVAPTTGTPHLQGYFELAKRRGPKGLAASLPGLARAFLQKAKGSVKHNRVYCGKDSTPYERGDPSEQGKRTDLIAVRDQIAQGASELELWENHFSTMVHNHRAIKTYRNLVSKKRDWPCGVLVLVGPGGTGKTQVANILMKSGYFGRCYTVPESKGSGLYFDGYDGEETIFIDEMDGGRMKPTTFNSICDRYPFSLPVHGAGNIQCLASTVIVCTNYLPEEWWRRGFNRMALDRRIGVKVFMGHDLTGLRNKRRKIQRTPTSLLCARTNTLIVRETHP